MIFKVETIKDYIKKKSNIVVDKIDKLNMSVIVGDTVEVSSDFTVSYFMDAKNSVGYERFNIKQLLIVDKIKYKKLLKFSRKRKLKNIK